jgi:hypothetical protein
MATAMAAYLVAFEGDMAKEGEEGKRLVTFSG